MPNFILAYHIDPAKAANADPDGQAQWKAWLEGLGDKVVNPGSPLKGAKTVSAEGVEEGGGPNPIMGYTVVKAESLDEALEIAQACPFLQMGSIEVAEILEMSF